jgi:ATP-binding cassette subfamily B protein
VRAFWRVLLYLTPYKWAFTVSTLLAAAAMAMTVGAIPALVGRTIDEIRAGDDQALPLLAAAVLAAGVARLVFSVFRRVISGRISLGVEHDMRRQIYEHLQSLEVGFFHDQQTGQLISRATVDLQVVRFFLGYGLTFMIQSVITLVIATVVMLTLDLDLALIALSVTPLVVWAAMHYGRLARPATQEVQQRMAEVSASVEESISGIRVVKAFAREQLRMDVFERAVARLLDQAMYATRLRAFNAPLIGFLPSLALAAVMLYGGNQVIDGSMTLGDFVQFYILVGVMLVPLRTFGNTLASAQRATAAGMRIFELVDRPPRIESQPGAPALPAGRGAVHFEHVSFTYPGANRPALDDVTIDVPAGTTVALVGETGSGKTTIVSLIPRLFDVSAGRLTVDGADVRDIDAASLRAEVALVGDDSFLFSATIADNIAYARDDVTEAEIQHAARRAQIADFIETLPDGYQTVIGERGITLSGGQRQRVAIARALLADPRVLLLDDATSSLDARTEDELKLALAEVMRDRTTFIIAHRLSTISLADRVVVLGQGRVAAQGTHEQLLRESELYREIATKGMPDSVFLTEKQEDVEEVGL